MTMLASPAEQGLTQRLSPDVLSQALVMEVPERTPAARLEGWLTNLAVVRPGRGDGATGSMLLFLAVAPVGRYGMGFRVLGSF